MRIKFARLLLGCLAFAAVSSALPAEEENYNLVFSTYFGGSEWEHARDVFTDADGYIYIVGGTASSDFPTTPADVYDRTFDSGGGQTGDAGDCDAFVSKFGPDGDLIWSTYLGGPNYDRAYAVEVDDDGYVYVSGRCGPGFPVTAGAFQTDYKGTYGNFYGTQNGFVVKLNPDGKTPVWSSYVGVGELCRNLALDSDGDIYLTLGYASGSGSVTPPGWFSTAFANAFQKTPQGGTDCGVVKVANDGTQVHWATWLGGSANDSQEASIRVDANKRVYIVCNTNSTNIPTVGAQSDSTYNGGGDVYVAQLESDGSGLIYATYIGGSGNESIETHSLAIDPQGNAYVSLYTNSSNFPTTAGAFDTTYGGSGDLGIVKISSTGEQLQATYIGGSAGDGPDGLYVDSSGQAFFVGETSSSNFPVTSNAYQPTFGGTRDGFAVRLSADFSELLYSTFMGGGAHDNTRSAFLGSDGSLYITGSTAGSGWPTLNAYQETFAGGGGNWGIGDNVLAKFERVIVNSTDIDFLFD